MLQKLSAHQAIYQEQAQRLYNIPIKSKRALLASQEAKRKINNKKYSYFKIEIMIAFVILIKSTSVINCRIKITFIIRSFII